MGAPVEGGGGFLEMGVGPSLNDDVMNVEAPNPPWKAFHIHMIYMESVSSAP